MNEEHKLTVGDGVRVGAGFEIVELAKAGFLNAVKAAPALLLLLPILLPFLALFCLARRCCKSDNPAKLTADFKKTLFNIWLWALRVAIVALCAGFMTIIVAGRDSPELTHVGGILFTVGIICFPLFLLIGLAVGAGWAFATAGEEIEKRGL